MTAGPGRRGEATWRDLLHREHVGAVAVLAGGVGLYATNVFVTTSLLPSAVAEIGGEQFYAWTTTVFLLASVLASVLVTRLLGTAGGRGAYGWALGVFAVGSVTCAVATDMSVLLAGRTVQGAGGGLLAGLGYALVQAELPAALWSRGTAAISAMWGVGTVAGPALGGAFAEFATWRGAFLVVVVATVAVGVLVPRALSGTRSRGTGDPVPLVSLLLLGTATLVVSVTSIGATAVTAVIGAVVGAMLILGFLAHERRRGGSVLPAATFTTGSRLGWVYATVAVLAIGSTVELFVPLFGQRLGGLGPLASGFLGAAIAAGWTAGELASAGASRAGTVRAVVVAGPALLAAGLAVTALVPTGGGAVLPWAAALLAAGIGIGIAWPHLAVQAMSGATDPDDSGRAAAAINTVQLVANAFGTAVAGLLVGLGGTDTGRAAQSLFLGFAAIAVVAVAFAWRGPSRTAG